MVGSGDMASLEEPSTSREWCERILTGPGGLESFLQHECGGAEMTPMGAALWVIRCLANPECQGSRLVLEQIQGSRAQAAAEQDAKVAAPVVKKLLVEEK